MRLGGISALIAISCIGLGACRFPNIPGLSSSKAPTGQVVATVDGKEITRTDLEAELAGFSAQDPKVRKAAEQQALQMLVSRRILADEARKEQLDKTPDFALQQQRATDGLLVQALQAKLANTVPAPTDEEAQRFITDNPDIFAQRKIFVVDTIRMARPSDPSLIKGLEPLKTLPDVEAYLTANHIDHAKSTGNLDMVGTDPKVAAKILKLPPNEVFIYPGPNGTLLVNQIQQSRVQPFEGADATKYAVAVLKRQRTQDVVARQMRDYVQADAKQVRYNSEFTPLPGAGQAAIKPAG